VKIHQYYGLLVIVLFSAALTYFNYEKREYDWDMPGYIGCLYETEFPGNKDEIHKKTYSSLRKEASKEEYEKIIGINEVNIARASFAKSPESFYGQIPYYQVKLSYNAVIYAFYKLGFSAALSTVIPNLILFFVTSVFLYCIFTTVMPKQSFLSVIFTAGIILLPDFRHLSYTTTPDMFSVFFLILFLYSVLKKYPSLLEFIILINLILIRPDYLVFVLCYYVLKFFYDFFTMKKIRFEMILYGCFAVVIYLLLIKFYQYPGWKEVFYDSFIHRRLHITSEEADFTFKDYGNIVLGNLMNFKKVTLAAVGMFGVSLFFSGKNWDKVFAAFLFVSIYIKFLFFPAAGETRFFLGLLILQLIWMVFILNTYIINKFALHSK